MKVWDFYQALGIPRSLQIHQSSGQVWGVVQGFGIRDLPVLSTPCASGALGQLQPGGLSHYPRAQLVCNQMEWLYLEPHPLSPPIHPTPVCSSSAHRHTCPQQSESVCQTPTLSGLRVLFVSLSHPLNPFFIKAFCLSIFFALHSSEFNRIF